MFAGDCLKKRRGCRENSEFWSTSELGPCAIPGWGWKLPNLNLAAWLLVTESTRLCFALGHVATFCTHCSLELPRLQSEYPFSRPRNPPHGLPHTSTPAPRIRTVGAAWSHHSPHLLPRHFLYHTPWPTTRRSRTSGVILRIKMASGSVGTRFQARAWYGLQLRVDSMEC